jgi:4a-hydroxytetrahydrobiopterin dehydratase
MSRLLEPDDVASQLADIPSWIVDGPSIRRTYDFPDFAAAIRWIDQMAVIAEAMNHHPDVDLRWRRVFVTLTTHSEGGITALDIDLAHHLESKAREFGVSA